MEMGKKVEVEIDLEMEVEMEMEVELEMDVEKEIKSGDKNGFFLKLPRDKDQYWGAVFSPPQGLEKYSAGHKLQMAKFHWTGRNSRLKNCKWARGPMLKGLMESLLLNVYILKTKNRTLFISYSTSVTYFSLTFNSQKINIKYLQYLSVDGEKTIYQRYT